jgi:hypothetical protein
VVHQLPAHPGDWREGAALEGGLMSSTASWSYQAMHHLAQAGRQ